MEARIPNAPTTNERENVSVPDYVSPTPPAPTVPIPNPSPQTGDDETIARLASMTPLEYDRERKQESKNLGIQLKTLDDLVKGARDDNDQSDRTPFPDVQPYPDPIDPTQLLNEISDAIRRFVVVDKVQADTCALWIAHTHFIDDIETSPILILNAPERECAKTLLQTVVGRMSHRPLPAANASTSALFRAVESWRPTLLIDEADTFFHDNHDLHGLVNAGYKHGGFVLRSESTGDSYEPRMFSVYSAKSIAGIALEKHVPDSTMSRGIVINMRRKLPHEKVERLRHSDPSLFPTISAKLARFAEDSWEQVRSARPVLPDALSDRGQDNWEPLLAIASCAGPDWVKRATDAALTLSSASALSVSAGNELLADIRAIFDARPCTKISTEDLIKGLVHDPEKSWSTYNRGKPISPRQLAKQLGAYGIKPKTVRLGHANTPKGYEVSEFADAFARYLAAPKDLPPQRNAAPEAMTGKAECVADDTQRPGGDALQSRMDKLLPIPSESEILGTMSESAVNDVGGEGVLF